MNSAYIFLLKRRYWYKWNNFKEKLKYYFDFSIVYIVFALAFVFAFYRDIMLNPPVILQSIASFLTLIPINFIVTIALLIFIQSSIKGLTSPPMYFNKGDTYFLFTLPIPKEHYIFFEWLLVQGKNILIVLGVLAIAIPIYPLIWDKWFINIVQIFFLIAIFIISLHNIQWLVFQLPMEIKKIILKILRYIRITFIVTFILSILYIAWVLYFKNYALFNFASQIEIGSYISQAYNVGIKKLILIGFCFISSVISIFFIRRTSLENLKESSLSHDRFKTLMSLGMTQEAKKIVKRKGIKEKRYFLSIPGYYKNSKIFLWRNLSQLIRQPLGYFHNYIIYLSLSIGIIISTKGEEISLIFIFIALYIIGQNMLSPIKKHYEENYFLSSFPMESKYILRGYMMLPFILSTIMGIVFSIIMGWIYKDVWIAIILSINIPFFSYFTLLASMRNVLEELNLELNTNRTLIMESTMLMQGAAPIIFGILFLTRGISLWIIGLCTALGYLVMAKTAEKEVIRPLQQVFNKYS
jgi:hypothetical protein